MARSDPVPLRPRGQVPLVSLGQSGLRQTLGRVYEEYLPELKGQKGFDTFRRMANDATVSAILFAIESLIAQVEWSVEPVDASPKAQAEADFVESLMEDMSHSWSDLIGEVCSMFVYGFAPLEIVWKLRQGPDQADPSRRSRFTDGRFGVRKLALRSQHSVTRWAIGADGGIDGLYQLMGDGREILIPIDRLLLFRTSTVANNPEGKSILRAAYRSWWLKGRIEDLEAVGMDRDLAGLPVMRLPSSLLAGTTPEERHALQGYLEMVQQVRRDQREGVILPSDRDEQGNRYYEFELLSAAGSRQFDTSTIIDRYDRRIATSVLADFIFLGQGASSSGSWALSSDKTELFAVALGTYLARIADTLNRHLLPRVWQLNGLDTELMPKWVPGDIESPDLGTLGAFLQAMTAAGAVLFPDRTLEDRLRSMAGLPPVPEDRPDMPQPGSDAAAAGFFGDGGQAADQPADQGGQGGQEAG